MCGTPMQLVIEPIYLLDKDLLDYPLKPTYAGLIPLGKVEHRIRSGVKGAKCLWAQTCPSYSFSNWEPRRSDPSAVWGVGCGGLDMVGSNPPSVRSLLRLISRKESAASEWLQGIGHASEHAL